MLKKEIYREGKTFKSVEIRINKMYLKNVEEAPEERWEEKEGEMTKALKQKLREIKHKQMSKQITKKEEE